jgi:hypothetical protein
VIKSTLNRLYKLGRQDLVHNVYLLGGATFIKNPIPQFDRFSKVVAGRVVNVFTADDSALKCFNYVLKGQAIGLKAIYEKDVERTDD